MCESVSHLKAPASGWCKWPLREQAAYQSGTNIHIGSSPSIMHKTCTSWTADREHLTWLFINKLEPWSSLKACVIKAPKELKLQYMNMMHLLSWQQYVMMQYAGSAAASGVEVHGTAGGMLSSPLRRQAEPCQACSPVQSQGNLLLHLPSVRCASSLTDSRA